MHGEISAQYLWKQVNPGQTVRTLLKPWSEMVAQGPQTYLVGYKAKGRSFTAKINEAKDVVTMVAQHASSMNVIAFENLHMRVLS